MKDGGLDYRSLIEITEQQVAVKLQGSATQGQTLSDIVLMSCRRCL